MTLKEKLQRSAQCKRYYQRKRKAVLEHKRTKNAINRHTRSLQRAIQAARAEIPFIMSAVPTKPRSESRCV